VPSHLIFVSLFLGIVSGQQGIELQADPEIRSILITLGGKELARLTKPPWKAEIDLGPELVPREMVAIGYDAAGNEVGRASQVLNIPRPMADLQIVRDGNSVRLLYTHLQFSRPRKTEVMFDGVKLKVDDELRARFPVADWTRPHIVTAQMRFDDDVVAMREVVVEGTRFSDTAESQLTPVAVKEISRRHPKTLDGCFSIDGEPVRASAAEKETAHVTFVLDPIPDEIAKVLDPTGNSSRAVRTMWALLDSDTTQGILWPVIREFVDPDSQAVSRLFEHSPEFQSQGGLIGLLTNRWPEAYDLPRLYADAVAVAGMRSAGRRGAVVLVFNARADVSHNDPAAVRRYLASIGVPFFVWSADPTAETSRWGTVEDISTIQHLRAATLKLRTTLAEQRVTWIHADPLRALRVKAEERCGFAPMSR
jgi:hypothetical protein